jgi:hypothetical protein
MEKESKLRESLLLKRIGKLEDKIRKAELEESGDSVRDAGHVQGADD